MKYRVRIYQSDADLYTDDPGTQYLVLCDISEAELRALMDTILPRGLTIVARKETEPEEN